MKILHVIPDSVVNPDQFFVGSTRDIRGRTQYFLDNDIDYEELIVKNRSDSYLLNQLKKTDLSVFSDVIIEYPRYPSSIKYLKKNYPGLTIFVRSHNAEFYHWMHYALAYLKHLDLFYRNLEDEGKSIPLRKIRKTIFQFLIYIRNSIDLLLKDFYCSRYADYILCISQWECENYWKYLAKNSKLVYTPYFISDIYIPKKIIFSPKKNICVSMMSQITGTFPFTVDANHNLIKMGMSGKYIDNWEFFIIGNKPDVQFKMPENFSFTGFIENIDGILSTAKVMALVSNFGFGFKTKILEAILYQCWIIVPKKLFSRLPDEIQKYCIIVNPNSPQSFSLALDKSNMTYPVEDTNSLLRKEAYSSLDRLLIRS